MKLSTLLLTTSTSWIISTTSTHAFQLSMNYYNNNNNYRSPLSQQYKSITSIHNTLYGSGGVRMSPPPGEPEPEVSLSL